MDSIELFNSYKTKYDNTIVIIREKDFYRTYRDDALILHYILNYKFNDEKQMIAFGVNAYSNVCEALNRLNISYFISDGASDILVEGDSSFFDYYLKMARKAYEKELEKNKIFDLFNKVLKEKYYKYDELYNYLKEINDT